MWGNFKLPEGYTERDIKKLIERDKELKDLNKYRDALSLFAEIIEGTKQGIIVTLDGRDTAGKGYTIKKVTEYLDTEVYHAVAFGIPTPEERKNWFARYSKHFPKPGEITFFDRSWYNRAMVEPVMGFCSQEEYDEFMAEVSAFEASIQWEFNAILNKVYLSIDKETQKKRLDDRKIVMKRWKSSKVDAVAQKMWGEYTFAKRQILEHTHTPENPWHVIDSTTRYLASIETIKLILNSIPVAGEEVAHKLKLDITPNKKVHRIWDEELKLMDEKKQFGKPFAMIQTPQIIRV